MKAMAAYGGDCPAPGLTAAAADFGGGIAGGQNISSIYQSKASAGLKEKIVAEIRARKCSGEYKRNKRHRKKNVATYGR